MRYRTGTVLNGIYYYCFLLGSLELLHSDRLRRSHVLWEAQLVCWNITLDTEFTAANCIVEPTEHRSQSRFHGEAVTL